MAEKRYVFKEPMGFKHDNFDQRIKRDKLQQTIPDLEMGDAFFGELIARLEKLAESSWQLRRQITKDQYDALMQILKLAADLARLLDSETRIPNDDPEKAEKMGPLLDLLRDTVFGQCTHIPALRKHLQVLSNARMKQKDGSWTSFYFLPIDNELFSQNGRDELILSILLKHNLLSGPNPKSRYRKFCLELDDQFNGLLAPDGNVVEIYSRESMKSNTRLGKLFKRMTSTTA